MNVPLENLDYDMKVNSEKSINLFMTFYAPFSTGRIYYNLYAPKSQIETFHLD